MQKLNDDITGNEYGPSCYTDTKHQHDINKLTNDECNNRKCKDSTNINDMNEHDNFNNKDKEKISYEEILIAMLNEKNAR